jgi:hypothetical protein
LIHLPAHNSDHNPIFLNTNSTSCFLPRPFRFEEFWSNDPSCEQVIELAWQKYIPPYPDNCLLVKLNHTKIALLKWNSLHFGNIHKKIKETLNLIDATQQAAPSSATSEKEVSLKLDLNNLLVKEESLWKSKSRETWLTCRDLNTKYFHTSTLIRRRANAVNFLKLDSGTWVSFRDDIGGNLISHFSNLFTISNPTIETEMLDLFSPVITEEENGFLCAIPGEEEVLEALSSLGSTKAPGPDRFTALFYKKYWHLIKKEVLVCVDHFFSNHCLLSEQNESFIALIPKASGSHTAHQFRPISLCNIVYKIISKILANRLKTTLPKIISPLQSAFVPKRNIQDNIILAHELLHSFKAKRGKGGFMFLKMDMEKAFDRMEWSFLLAIMEKLGFSQTWLSWIKICISTPSLSILLNGSPFGCISPGRGLRQGDPLSTFLFILGVEVFSRLMFKEESEGSIQGLKIARSCPAINHLLFADDLLIFGKATVSVAANIKSCLEKYCNWSGQLINPSKSSIRFSKNTWPARIAAISVTFPYPSILGTSMYLGLPILLGNAKKRVFQGIIDKVKSRIEGWRAKTLFQAGRLTLIKSVAAALPSYAMSTFLLPSSFSSELDRIFKKFWWGFPTSKKKNLSLKAWDSLYMPKDLGGLGLRKMKEVNLALISKLGWKLLTNFDSMWVAQLHCKYLHSSSFLSSSSLSSPSWLWKGILKSISIISKGDCNQIHSLSSLLIWSSTWIPTLPSFIPSPSPWLPHPYPDLKVVDLFSKDPDSSVIGWNIPLLNYLFDVSTTREVLKTNFSSHSDRNFIWTPFANGLFSTKSALKLISNQRNHISTSPFPAANWKKLWKLNLNDRLKLFL